MIYFDNGATMLPKPLEVKKAALKAMDAGNPGRGGHSKAMEGARILYRARQVFGEHFGAESPDQVCFFYNATTALNCVIKSLSGKGRGLIISNMEHNAVRRPALSVAEKGAPLEIFNGYGSEDEVCASFENCLKCDTALAVFLYTSNICPVTLPIKRLTEICRTHGVLSVIDCAQAGGHWPVRLNETGADGLVFPSHKGLMGMAGAGILVASLTLKKALENAPTLMEGGSGIYSYEAGMPQALPERLEWGTGALPAIASAAAGVKYIERIGYDEIARREKALFDKCVCRLRSLNGIHLHGMNGEISPDFLSFNSLRQGGACYPHCKQNAKQTFENGNAEKETVKRDSCGPLLFTAEGVEGSALAQALFDRGVCVREGFHCAPFAHTTIGTEKTGGIRISFSPFNRLWEVDRFFDILKEEYGRMYRT